jgi:hypothetical protein
MGMKKHAIMICTNEMRTASESFIQRPNAVNFLTVTACMHALQLAKQTSEDEIKSMLAGATSDRIVEILDKRVTNELAELKTKIENGTARVIGLAEIEQMRERAS